MLDVSGMSESRTETYKRFVSMKTTLKQNERVGRYSIRALKFMR